MSTRYLMRSRPRLEGGIPPAHLALLPLVGEDWEQLIGEWRRWMQAAGRPRSTLRLRCYQLRRFAELHPVDCSSDAMISWLTSAGWSPETKKSYRAALVCFYRWAQRRGHLDHDPTIDLPPVRTPQRPPRPAPEAALREALLAADPRTHLMLRLAGHHGMRRGEIAQVHTDDILEDLVGHSLIVHGKGAKDRIIPLSPDVADELASCLRGWVFPSPQGGHLTAQHVGKILANALPDGWTAHTLRHRFATVAYAGTKDLLAVQTMLGHSKPETTRGYVLTPQDDLRATLRAAA